MKNFKWLEIAVVAVQVLDIFIHAATDQMEILRVTSNIVILLWLAVLYLGKLRSSSLFASLGTIGLYFALNLVFLAREGLTNPEQGGAPRIALFILVFLTVVVSAFLTAKYRKHPAQ